MKANFNRTIDESRAKILSTFFSKALDMKLTPEQVNEAADLFVRVESGLHGRIAGDIDDYLLNFFIRKKAAQVFREGRVQVEIGLLFGGSFIYTLLGVLEDSNDIFIGIDPLNGYYINDPERASYIDHISKVPVTKDVLLKNIDIFNIPHDRYEILEGYSTDKDILANMKGVKVSVLFIDGDHTYQGVKSDYELYAPVVEEGGYIIFDNYNDYFWPEVKLYCDELLSNPNCRVCNPIIFNRSLIVQKGNIKSAKDLISFQSNYNYISRDVINRKAVKNEINLLRKEIEIRDKEIERKERQLKWAHSKIEEKQAIIDEK